MFERIITIIFMWERRKFIRLNLFIYIYIYTQRNTALCILSDIHIPKSFQPIGVWLKRGSVLGGLDWKCLNFGVWIGGGGGGVWVGGLWKLSRDMNCSGLWVVLGTRLAWSESGGVWIEAYWIQGVWIRVLWIGSHLIWECLSWEVWVDRSEFGSLNCPVVWIEANSLTLVCYHFPLLKRLSFNSKFSSSHDYLHYNWKGFSVDTDKKFAETLTPASCSVSVNFLKSANIPGKHQIP